jgi:hypothetical protein
MTSLCIYCGRARLKREGVNMAKKNKYPERTFYAGGDETNIFVEYLITSRSHNITNQRIDGQSIIYYLNNGGHITITPLPRDGRNGKEIEINITGHDTAIIKKLEGIIK